MMAAYNYADVWQAPDSKWRYYAKCMQPPRQDTKGWSGQCKHWQHISGGRDRRRPSYDL